MEELPLPMSVGDTIGMLINRDGLQRDAPYTIKYQLSNNSNNSSGVGIKFQSIPAQTDESAGAGAISFPISANPEKKKKKMAKEYILVVGFVNYDLQQLDTNGNKTRPELGARLIAIDSTSIETGDDWTLAKVKDTIASYEVEGRNTSLTFRNDVLSIENIAYLNSILVRRKSIEEESFVRAQDESHDDMNSADVDDTTQNDAHDICTQDEPHGDVSSANVDDTAQSYVAVPPSPAQPNTPTPKSIGENSSPPVPRPSPDVFEYLHSQQVLSIHSGRVVSEDNDEVGDDDDHLSSKRSSIISSDSEDCNVGCDPAVKGRDENDAQNDANATAAATSTLSRPNMADIFATAIPSARQSPSLLKKAQSLGWRNRYSQAELYPVEITPLCFSSSSSSSAPITYHVRQVQRGETDGTYGTGATVWPASIVLLKYLEKAVSKDPSFLNNKAVIDLGAGTCVTSIATALLGAELVVCTDGNDHVVSLASDIVDMACKDMKSSLPLDTKAASSSDARMIGKCEMRIRKFWWGEDDESMLDELILRSSSSEDSRRYYDMILVSDCVLPKLYPIEPLVLAISALSGPDTVTYLSFEHRYYPKFDPRDRFRDLCQENDLTVRVIPIEDQDAKYSADDIEIWQVTRSDAS